MCGASSADALGQLRVVSMNSSNSGSSSAGPRAGVQTILNAIGSGVSDDQFAAGNTGIAKRIDVLLLQEYNGPATSGAGYAALLNTMYGTTTFSYGTLGGATTGTGTQGIVFNSATVNLLGQAVVGTSSTTGQPRQTLRYQLRPVGYGAGADVYVYDAHFKAGSDATSANRRNIEATAIRADVSAHIPAGANVLYAGDFNTYKGTEACLNTLTAAGPGQAFDPINRMTWSATNADRALHTQSPFDPNTGATGFTGGGMDSRFDWQMISANLNDRHGVSYIPGSYQAWGNNGTHVLSGPIDSGTGAPTDVLTAMSSVLDHLPIVADYTIPARLSASVGVVPPRVIQGAGVTVPVNVTNSANVQFANGADVLNCTIAGSGAVTGSTNVVGVAAKAPSNVSVLALGSSTPGTSTGTVTINATSEAAADATYSASVSTQVLEHAHPTMSTQTIDFGIIPRHTGLRSREFSIANSLGAVATAALDLDAIVASGNTSAFTTDLAPFANLPASVGATDDRDYAVALSTGRMGSFRAAYELHFSDENLPGAQSLSPMTLQVVGTVAIEGDADLSGVIDAPDFIAIDNGYLKGGRGTWSDGDSNLDGTVDFADYALMDESLIVQFDAGGPSGAMSRAIRYLDSPIRNESILNIPELQRLATNLDRFGEPYAQSFLAAVPEPTTPSLFLLSVALVSRRRRIREMITTNPRRRLCEQRDV